MRFHGLDLNLLVVLDALLTDRSLTVVAERLHRTQPAISASLRRLRDFFGDELFVMSGRDFLPTPLALTLAQPVREALNHIRSVVIEQGAFDPLRSTRHFRIIMSDYMAVTFFHALVRDVAEEAPGITFELISFDDEFDGPLTRGEVDFLFFPDVYLSDRHPSCALFDEELVVVRCAQHAEGPLTQTEFFSAPHVAARFGKTRKPAIEEFLMSELGLRRRIEVAVPNFTMIPHFVAGTRRLATMHRRLAEAMADRLPLRVDPLPFALPTVRERLQWPQLNQADPASIWLRERVLTLAEGSNQNARMMEAIERTSRR